MSQNLVFHLDWHERFYYEVLVWHVFSYDCLLKVLRSTFLCYFIPWFILFIPPDRQLRPVSRVNCNRASLLAMSAQALMLVTVIRNDALGPWRHNAMILMTPYYMFLKWLGTLSDVKPTSKYRVKILFCHNEIKQILRRFVIWSTRQPSYGHWQLALRPNPVGC